MPQIFRPSLTLFIKLVFFGALLALVVLVVAWRMSIEPRPAIETAVRQPVPFSHKHHVGDDGLDCRYCHSTVETSRFAGLPPTSTCLTCHSQLFRNAPVLAPVFASLQQEQPLAWTRVHDLPDFVYFDHSIHVAKGVGCTTCHGPVDRMPLTWRVAPLTMQWCLECHRAPEKFIRPRERVFDTTWQPGEDQIAQGKKLVAAYHIRTGQLTDCSICHR